jgi:putative ABC transport system permease protein
MRFVSLAWKNALRNKRRSILTILSLAASLFLLTTLLTVLHEFEFSSGSPKSALRVITHHAVSFTQPIPIAYKERIKPMPGVSAIMAQQWFGGVYVDESNFFAQFGVDADSFFDCFTEFQIPADQKADFIRQRNAAIVGKSLLDRFKWKVGQHITLKGTIYPVDLDLIIAGVYTSPNPPDEGTLWFHWDYLDESTGRPGSTNNFVILASSAQDVPKLINSIDETFRNSTAPTKTETEKEFGLSFSGMMGNIKFLVGSISVVVVFTILLVTAATMGMSIRERTSELGILKSLGFTSGLIVALLVGESMIIALSGWLIGCVGARILYGQVNMSGMTAGFFTVLRVQPNVIAGGFLLSIMVAVLTAGVPAWRASRLNIAEALRHVG